MTSKIIHSNCQIFKLELLFILSSSSVHQGKTCSSSMTISYNHITLKLFINNTLDNWYLLAILLLIYELVQEKKSKKIYKMKNIFIVIKLYWVPFSICPIFLPYNSIKMMVYGEKKTNNIPMYNHLWVLISLDRNLNPVFQEHQVEKFY